MARNTQTVHPTALMTGADLGMDTHSMREVVAQVAEDNPALLIGGYNIDVIIVSMAAVLMLEDGFQKDPKFGGSHYTWQDTDRDLVISTINACINKISADGQWV